MYISISFQQICITFICPCCVGCHPGRFIKEQTGRTRSAWSCSTHPRKLCLVSPRVLTSIPPSLRIPTPQPVCLNSRALPPAPELSEAIQASPPSPALHRGLVRHRTSICRAFGSFSAPCCGSGSLWKQAASRVTVQSENVNQPAGHWGKYKSGAYPQAVPRSLTWCEKSSSPGA